MYSYKSILIIIFTIIFLACGKESSTAPPEPLEESIIKVTEVLIEQDDFTLIVGEDQLLSAVALPINASNKKIIWQSSDQTILSIDSSGKVLALNTGTAVISAKSDENVQLKDEVAVEVLNEETTAAFITTWNTELGNPSEPFIIIPTFPEETYNYQVEWGDGSIESNLAGDATHVYSTHGEYQIKITGMFPRIYFNYNNPGVRRRIISIDQWGSIAWSSMEKAFAGCENLELLGTDIPNLNQATSLKEMFSLCRNFKGAGSMNSWDVTNIEDTSNLFSQCDVFDADISSWNTSSVEDMSGMFLGCDLFNQDIGGWDVSSVRVMNSMFSESYTFNQDIGDWDVSNVTDLSWMFASNGVFNQNIESWNVSNVTDTNAMFLRASSFNQPLGSWDVSSVVNMSSMFSNAISFNQDISNWNVSGVTDMGGGLFSNLIDFNVDLSSWNVSNVEHMGAMFAGCSSFNQDISSWNVSKVTSMLNMFGRATVFNQDLSSWDVSNVTNMKLMFSAAEAFNQNISTWDVSNVFTMEEMFSEASNFDQNLGDWNISKVNNMKNMFEGVQLSTTNYDGLLEGWNSLANLKINVQFDGGESQYCNSQIARQNIGSSFNWSITDGGYNCD